MNTEVSPSTRATSSCETPLMSCSSTFALRGSERSRRRSSVLSIGRLRDIQATRRTRSAAGRNSSVSITFGTRCGSKPGSARRSMSTPACDTVHSAGRVAQPGYGSRSAVPRKVM
jgi:hypothetical protein